MRVTPKWQDWAVKMTSLRLQNMLQHLKDQREIFGSLDEVDELLLKVLSAEVDRRHARG